MTRVIIVDKFLFQIFVLFINAIYLLRELSLSSFNLMYQKVI